jgi:ribulose-phosphate 3-epimerase
MTPQETRVLPSVLSANFAHFARDVNQLEAAGCDLFHMDVMDGQFVPNLTFGPKLVRDLAEESKARFDCHLMVVRPEAAIPWFNHPSVEFMTIHAEATVHLHRALHQIRDMGKKAGVSLNPGTPLSLITNVLPDMDLLLLMTVNPGFGGQKYIPQMTDKITAASILCEAHGIILEVDGGINDETIPQVVRAGARYLVTGGGVYHQDNPAEAWKRLSETAAGAMRTP